MIPEFFSSINAMLYASPGIALAGAFLWGVAGMVLSPCHLAGIPLVVGFIDSQGDMRTSRAALISSFFSAGILITIGLVGLVTGLAGRMLGDIGEYGNAAVAVIVIVVGLYLLGIVPLPFPERGINQPGVKRKGLMAAFMLGLIFGLALGPCTFAFMAPMLGVAFNVASTDLLYAFLLVGTYALGHCIIIIIAGTFSEAVQHMLNWNENSKGACYLKKTCGILVVATGVYMLVTLF